MTDAALPLAYLLSFVLSAVFIGYVIVILRSYLRERSGERGEASSFGWHLFVPARDEEAVIGETIAVLLGRFPEAHVWLIDDDSHDATAQIAEARAGGCDRLHLVRRRPPDARDGKGPALNAAYRALDAYLPATVDRGRMIVGVVDADGRPARDALEVVAGPRLFGNPAVGGVQTLVRMGNRHDPRPVPGGGRWANALGRMLIRLQDLEFRGPISAMQAARSQVRTVGMGGNGQFTRLSALDELAADGSGPWRGSLLEDFEIGVHLLLAGWRTKYTTDTLVDQEGVNTPRRFLVQRTRWSQGVMQCIRYLPHVGRSSHIGHLGALELAYYLSQPWLSLIGTFVYSVPVVVFAVNTIRDPGVMASFVIQGGGWGLVSLYLLLGIGPYFAWAFAYRARHEPELSRRFTLGLGVGLWIYTYSVYVAAWRAAWRLACGRSGWAKTRRSREPVGVGPVALDA